MKKDELKLRIVTELNNLVDIYFGDGTLVDKMANTTLKIMVNKNKDKFDGMLDIFADENGDIDAEAIVNQYAEHFSVDGTKFDIRNYIKSDLVKGLLPDKFLIINKSDILNIVRKEN